MPEKLTIERMNDGIRELGEIEVSCDGRVITLTNTANAEGEHDDTGSIADHWIDVPLSGLLEAIGRSIRS